MSFAGAERLATYASIKLCVIVTFSMFVQPEKALGYILQSVPAPLISMLFSAVQLAKALFPIVRIFSPRVICSMDEQFSNALSPIYTVKGENDTSRSAVQLAKALPLMVLVSSPRVIFSMDEQFSNALSPISVVKEENDMSRSEVQFINASCLISNGALFINMEVRLLHPLETAIFQLCYRRGDNYF